MNFQILCFCNFKMKYFINRMNCNILSQQMTWFDGRGVCFHFKGQAIKPLKWCVRGQQW
jgi:hypothetical protein